MVWLIYCAFFVLMLISIFRMLMRQGKWAWGLFLGLIASVAGYVGLFVLPVAQATALQDRRVLLTVILLGGTLLYIGLMFYCIRRVAAKIKSRNPPR
jgi:predicted membrane protein